MCLPLAQEDMLVRKKFKQEIDSESEDKFVDFGAITLFIYAATLFIIAFNEFLFW